MANTLSYLAHMAAYSGDAWREKYTGLAKGQRVNIVGAGPSAANYKLRPGEHTILLNSTIKQFLDATPEQAPYLHALTSESTVWLLGDWFWGNEQFPGSLLAEKYAGTKMPPEKIIRYPEEYWARFLWFERRPSIFEGEQRDCGLWYVPGHYDAVGSVQAQALDLAYRVMGASEVHSIGCELMFPDGAQHWDDWQPYTDADTSIYTDEGKDHQTQVCRYNLLPAFYAAPPEGARDAAEWIEEVHAACKTPDGNVYSTPFFVKSALAIRIYLATHPACKLVDHSGGLLSNEAEGDTLRGTAPAKLRKAKAAG